MLSNHVPSKINVSVQSSRKIDILETTSRGNCSLLYFSLFFYVSAANDAHTSDSRRSSTKRWSAAAPISQEPKFNGRRVSVHRIISHIYSYTLSSVSLKDHAVSWVEGWRRDEKLMYFGGAAGFDERCDASLSKARTCQRFLSSSWYIYVWSLRWTSKWTWWRRVGSVLLDDDKVYKRTWWLR